MRKKYRGKDLLEELEAKEKGPVIPIVIFLCVVTVLSVITTLGIKLLEEHTDIDIPWTDNKKDNPTKKPQTSSRDQMELTVPILSMNQEPKEELGALLDITRISKDKSGFKITFSLKTTSADYTTIEAKQICLDGFYFTTTFAFSDRVDYNSQGNKLLPQEQIATEYEFLIKKSELDELDMFGFNYISIVYDLFTPTDQVLDKEYYLKFNNSFGIVNERKGLINIDKKNDVQVSYYKNVAAEDATYIYFDFKNENKFKDIKIYVKELVINNKVYDMSSFEDVSHRNCREAIYLKIPTKDVPRVNTMKVEFFLVDDNVKNEKAFYITNEYQRAF